MIKLPKERRGYFCTKCQSSECVEGTIEQQHPPCAKCGYLGFAQDQGYDLSQLKQAVRDALNLAADTCESTLYVEGDGTVSVFGPKTDANVEIRKCHDAIRALIKEIK